MCAIGTSSSVASGVSIADGHNHNIGVVMSNNGNRTVLCTGSGPEALGHT